MNISAVQNSLYLERITMTDHNQPKQTVTEDTPSATAAYERILERVYLSIENLEQQSWPLLEQKIKEAAEIELAAEDMTREEIDLLQAYLRRDLADLGFFVHKTGEGVAAWLNFDLNILEFKLGELLKGLADKTRLDHVYLEQRLSHGPEEYVAGEISTAGTLRCLNCGTLVTLEQTSVIEPCDECDARYFHRESNRD